MNIGLIGAGAIGTAIARALSRSGMKISIANSRGPASLAGLVAELGPLARAVTVKEAAQADLVFLAVNWSRIPAALEGLGSWEGRILVDANNPIEAPAWTVLERSGRRSGAGRARRQGFQPLAASTADGRPACRRRAAGAVSCWRRSPGQERGGQSGRAPGLWRHRSRRPGGEWSPDPVPRRCPDCAQPGQVRVGTAMWRTVRFRAANVLPHATWTGWPLAISTFARLFQAHRRRQCHAASRALQHWTAWIRLQHRHQGCAWHSCRRVLWRTVKGNERRAPVREWLFQPCSCERLVAGSSWSKIRHVVVACA